MALILADVSVSRYKAVTGETRWQAHIFAGGDSEGPTTLVDGFTVEEVMDKATEIVCLRAATHKAPWEEER